MDASTVRAVYLVGGGLWYAAGDDGMDLGPVTFTGPDGSTEQFGTGFRFESPDLGTIVGVKSVLGAFATRRPPADLPPD